uniref:Fibronectin type-III domain-containing protein n=1 Tax=Hucho hucho TaxID=62062 RepID=A0A4W5L4S9_9TELE
MADSETIETAALGRPFQLGMLYDCRRDVLIPGITLWDSEILQKDINVSPQPNTDFKIIASDSSEDKSEALNVSASLEASFLGGLVSVKGSAEFLHDKKTSKHQSRVSLQYRSTTRFEQLTMDHLGAGNVKHCNVFQEGSATHVVTAILYGAQAFFVFDREVSSGENHQDIQGNLQATIKKIPLISIEGQASLKMSEEEKQQANTFSCTFHGDFALENNPVTFEDATRLYAGLPRLLGEKGEHAVPMTVWLYPLKNLDSAAAQLVRQISVSLVRRAQRILDGLDNTDVTFRDMMKEDMAIKFPEIKAKLSKFRDLCSEYKLVFQKGLCKVLPNIRGGGMEEEELIKMLNSKERSPFQNDLLITYLDDREREMNVVSSYLDIMKEVQVVCSTSELDGIVLDQATDHVVCFAFSSLKDKDEYVVDLENYLLEESKSDSSLIPYDPNAAGKSAAEKWFRSGEVTTLTRQTIQLFLDFKESNKDRENIAFCIASIPNKLITASSIHVYERGTLLSPQFELPTKPGVPTIKSLEHDSVHVQINPPKLGVKSVESYQVLYQAVQAESEWTEVKADATTNQVTIRRLNPYKDYRFSCRAVCRPGVSLSSDWTEYFRTRPCSPPGPPTEKNLESESIRVNWDIPTMVGDDVEVIGYEVDYRECAKAVDNKMWHTIKTTTRECTLEGLKPETAYSVRVSANCGDAGKSLPSPEAVLTTIRASDTQPKRSQSTATKSEEFLKKSEKVKKGNPSIYRLNLEQKLGVKESFEQYTFGRKVEKGNNKVILLLGCTGSGKTTLVNVMINYILGVKWEDRYRFKLIHEVTNRSQAESQTSIVTSYEVYNQPGFQIPYSLTIIDTPGFGDTRGMAHDKLITEQVKEFLCNPLGIDHIDAVCFVVQASLARLSANQKYIFDSILSIFGKDVADNILMLVTFADGKDIAALEAIQAADLPCRKNKKGLPTHFKFNNSALLHQKVEEDISSDGDGSEDDNDEALKDIVWKSTFKQMKAFFKDLESIESKDLTMTKKVLEERERLEQVMTRLAPQITAGLSKLNEIKTVKQCLENDDVNLKQNQDFETEVEVLVAKRTKSNCFATNCIICQFTCHTSCFLPNEDDIIKCAVMDDNGKCVMCPRKCFYHDHDKEKALWTYETKTEKKTIKELKDNFMKAQGKFMNNKQMLEKIEDEYVVIEDKLINLIKMSSNCLKRLNEIALKPSSLSTVEYIEMLIRTEEDECKPGFEDRIVGLKKMKYESELLEKIARGEQLLPDERRKLKEKQDRLQKITKRVNQMQKVVRDWPGKK